MRELEAAIYDTLLSGVDAHLFSAAAAGVSTSRDRFVIAVGTPSYDDPHAISTGTLFDLASLTKPYVALTTMALVDQHMLDLDSAVAELLPVGRGSHAERITLRMLLRHTSGLPATSEVWRNASIPPSARLARVLGSNLVHEPDQRFIYSCVGYVALGAVIETVTSERLSEVLRKEVLSPLGLEHTQFGPVPFETAVATEFEPHVGRGLVRGEVHDELSWYLGGKTGNAGLFAPVDDVLRFAESFLKSGILSGGAWREMTVSSLTSDHGAPFGHGLGLRIGDAVTMGSSRGFGHTGFTGTLWVTCPDDGWAVTLLTNRVHPDREAVTIAPFRRRFLDVVKSFL